MDVNEEMKRYRERWKEVEEIEIAELRSLSMDDRLNNMEIIWRMGKGLGFSFEPEESELAVFARWAKIKELG